MTGSRAGDDGEPPALPPPPAIAAPADPASASDERPGEAGGFDANPFAHFRVVEAYGRGTDGMPDVVFVVDSAPGDVPPRVMYVRQADDGDDAPRP